MADDPKALGGRAQLFRNIFEQSVIGIALTDLDGSVIESNDAFRRMLGYSEEELRRTNVAALTHPDDWPEEAESFRLSMEPGKSDTRLRRVKRYRRKDGSFVWVRLHACMIRDAHGAPVFGLGMAEDISEQKATEDRLRESEERYRLLFTESVSGFSLNEIICDATGRPCDYVLLDANPAFEKLTGLRRDQVVGRTVREVIPTIEELWIERFGAVAQTGLPVRFTSFVAGLKRWYDVFAYSPKPGQFAVTFTDITESRDAENRAAAERERLAITLRSIGDAVVTAGADGRIETLNPVAEALTGWTAGAAAGRGVPDVVRLADGTATKGRSVAFDRVLRGEGAIEFTTPHTLTSRAGTERFVTGSASPILDRDGKAQGMVMVLRDVTEPLRREAEQALTEKLRSLGFLAGGIAHDFNNLLTAILGNITLAAREPGRSDTAQLLTAAEEATLKARALTQQLLTFAEGGEPVKRVQSPAETVREAAEMAMHGSASVLACNLDPHLWRVDMDAGQVGQVIRNLTINADQAMPGGGRVVISADNVEVPEPGKPSLSAGRYVRIAVSDAGVGIPPQNLDKLFDPYFTTKPKGSGMGLATSRSIVRRHGGQIAVKSRVGIGSTFEIYLPAVEGDTAEVPAPSPVAQPPGRILIMDDEDAIRQIASRILNRSGFEADAVPEGKAAVSAYSQAMREGHPYNAVILDLTIRGGMGGRETLRALQEIDPGVKAIVSSGYSNDPVMSNHRQCGFRGVVTKPYQIEDLVATVRRVAAEPA